MGVVVVANVIRQELLEIDPEIRAEGGIKKASNRIECV